MVIQRHEQGIYDDTQRDEEVNKWVEDNHGENLGKANVEVTAVPHAHHIHALDTKLGDPLFQPKI